MMASALTRERLSAHIANVEQKLAGLDADRRTALDAAMALEGDEHFRFQTLQAESHASGALTTDAALIVYAALGEIGSASNGGWSAETGTATKVAITQLMGELLERRIRGAS